MSAKETAKLLEEQAERLERNAERQDQIEHEAEELAHQERQDAEALREEAEDLREEAERKPDGDGDGRRPHEPCAVELTISVNGVRATIIATETERLAEVRLKALEETKNLGQPPENWEIKNEEGVLLDPERDVGSYHFGEKAVLFLSLKAGAAGV